MNRMKDKNDMIITIDAKKHLTKHLLMVKQQKSSTDWV